MRCVAAAIVFLTHIIQAGIFTDAQLNQDLNRWFAKTGFAAVGFFIMLSGFILTYSAGENDRPLRFWIRRLSRIYPTHILLWVVSMALMAWLTVRPAFSDALPSFFLVQAWTSNEKVIWAVNGQTWTLCGDLLFYLAFPWLIRLVRRIPGRLLWLCAGCLVAAVTAVALIGDLVTSSTPELPFIQASWAEHWLVFNHPVTRMLDFVLGIVMAQILLTGRWIRVPRTVAMLTLVASNVIALEVPGTFGLVVPFVVPLALVMTAAAAADLEGESSVFRLRTMVRIGELSFAFYMTHSLVTLYGPIGRLKRTWPVAEGVGLIVLTYVLILIVSWILTYGFERPLYRWLTRSAGPSKPFPPALPQDPGIPVQAVESKY
ncbi:acyltransferase [Streptomyces sp. NPDC026206]|uniref:acyltransferase family protein n=1 Tax=Streptomyces sp. NPDC026206 TaxID=3157089 RepID=UPI0034031A08